MQVNATTFEEVLKPLKKHEVEFNAYEKSQKAVLSRNIYDSFKDVFSDLNHDQLRLLLPDIVPGTMIVRAMKQIDYKDNEDVKTLSDIMAECNEKLCKLASGANQNHIDDQTVSAAMKMVTDKIKHIAELLVKDFVDFIEFSKYRDVTSFQYSILKTWVEKLKAHQILNLLDFVVPQSVVWHVLMGTECKRLIQQNSIKV